MTDLMMWIKRSAFLAALLTSLCVAGAAFAAGDSHGHDDEEDDEDEFSMSFDEKLAACAACHGENGDKPLAPDYPILAGQYADYLEQALNAYATGKRDHPIMSMQIEILELTASDMKALAEHFAAKPGLKNISN